jgi:hypothetical protein
MLVRFECKVGQTISQAHKKQELKTGARMKLKNRLVGTSKECIQTDPMIVASDAKLC